MTLPTTPTRTILDQAPAHDLHADRPAGAIVRGLPRLAAEAGVQG